MSDDEPNGPAIQVSVNVQPRAEKVAWVALEIATPLNFFSVAFPPEQAELLGEGLTKAIRDAVQECKRIASGIIVSNNVEGLK